LKSRTIQGVDKFDQQIISRLQSNSRESLAAIGRDIGLSRSAIAERIQRLEERGIIQGYTIRLGEAGQKAVQAYFQLSLSPFKLDELLPTLQTIPEIRMGHALSGEVDLILFAETESMERLNQIRRQLEQLPDLKRLLTCPVLQSITKE
jgi:Lrp/AsnC family leucine-responsive transcriptional regulator